MTINEFLKKLKTIEAKWYFDKALISDETIRADSDMGICLCPINLVFRHAPLYSCDTPGNSFFYSMGTSLGLSLADTKTIVYTSDNEGGCSKKLRRRLKQIVGLM